jgi:hypothetical protein
MQSWRLLLLLLAPAILAEGARKARVICTMIRNEARYISHWLDFHLNLVGFDRVYLYDDNSTDNLIDVIKPYVKRNQVVRIPVDWPTERLHKHAQSHVQMEVFNMCAEMVWNKLEALYVSDPRPTLTPPAQQLTWTNISFLVQPVGTPPTRSPMRKASTWGTTRLNAQ